MMPKVSVIIPVYKTPEEYLRSCIDSVLKQSMTDFEAILIDDGSPDQCGAICDEYAAIDSRIRVIHQKNKGVSSARNTGIKVAKGEYLTCLDSDDLLYPHTWETLLRVFDFHPCDCIIFGWNDFTPDGSYPHTVTETMTEVSAKEAIFQIASDNFLCGGGYPWNKIWNAETLRNTYGEIPIFDEEIYTYEDKLWIIENLKNLNKVLLIPDILYEYRFVSTSLTQDENAWKHRQFNAYDAYDKICDKLKILDKHAYEGALKFYFYFCFTDLKIIYPNRKAEYERFIKTKKRLYLLSKRIHLGELHKAKYIIAWLYFRILGWIE